MKVERVLVAAADTCVECNAQDITPLIAPKRTMIRVAIGGDAFQICQRHASKLREELNTALWAFDLTPGVA